jgi:hypothetical protein
MQLKNAVLSMRYKHLPTTLPTLGSKVRTLSTAAKCLYAINALWLSATFLSRQLPAERNTKKRPLHGKIRGVCSPIVHSTRNGSGRA